MVLSRIRSFFGFSIFLRIGLAVCAAAAPVLGYAREVLAVAFPAADPRAALRFRFTPSRVLGLPSLRAFRDSILSRMGDGRERSPLSVAFVT